VLVVGARRQRAPDDSAQLVESVMISGQRDPSTRRGPGVNGPT
jgi:hypothetical protein